MLDGAMRRVIDPPLNALGASIARLGIKADWVTLAGLAIGIGAALAVSQGQYLAGLVLLIASRLLDGLDGAVARTSAPTDFGGYLDITCDFLFYGLFPLGFVLADPASNAVWGAVLLASFYFNGSTFLGFAELAAKHRLTTASRGLKSLYFTGGLLEGTETIAFFAALCLWPQQFSLLAGLFAAGCFITGGSRIVLAWRIFAARRAGASDLVEPEA